jgi:selenocysteine-specific elongation factor
VVAEEQWAHWRSSLRRLVQAHDAAHPLDRGLPHESVRRSLALPDRAVLLALAEDAGLVSADGRIRPAGEPGLGRAEAGVARLEQRLGAEPFAAPERPELEALGLGTRELAAAAAAGRLLRLQGADGSDVVLLPDAPARAVRLLSALPQPFTPSAARTALGTTRRVAIPLLEHLDARGRTRRVDAGGREVVPR